MDLTHAQLRNMVDVYSTRRHDFKSWYAFIESIGVGERIKYPNQIIYILDPLLFTLACIRYGF